MRELRSPECIRVLCTLGFVVEGSTPIRVVLSRGGRKVFVPKHGPLTGGELGAILVVAGVAETDFERVRREVSAVHDSYVRELAPQGHGAGSARRSGLWVSLNRVLGSVGARRAG